MLSPAGLSENSQANVLNRVFVSTVFDRGPRRLGDAIRETLSAFSGLGGPREILDVYQLL